MKITLVCGGPSSEHEVSINSTKAILSAIDKDMYDVSIFYITKDFQSTFFKPMGEFKIPNETIAYSPLIKGIEHDLKNTDLALLAGIHGEFVEDGQLQGLLDLYNIHYSGSGRSASALCMDKFRSSLIIQTLGSILLPQTQLIDLKQEYELLDWTYPLICKPNNMGSSVGLAVIDSKKELEQYLDGLKVQSHYRYVLLQEYIQDTIEVSCGCLQEKNGDYTFLPPVEIIPQASRLFDYRSKYEEGGATEISPPPSLRKELTDAISQIARDAHSLLGCRTYSRSDFLVKGDDIYYMETNTLPGMTKTSLLPKEAKAIGMEFKDLISFLIENS